MAPGSSSVSVRLAEPVIFLANLDSATDRRERRQQRRRQQQQDAAISANATTRAGSLARQPPGGFANSFGPSGGGMDYAPSQSTFVPPSGRGGAGSRSRSRGRNAQGEEGGGSRSPSASRARGRTDSPSQSQSRGRGRSPVAARGSTPTPSRVNGGETDEAQRIEPEDANIDLARPPAVIRAVMTVTLSKPTKIKKIGVKLKGVSKTEWPEGIGTRRLDTTERTTLIEKQVIFFDARTSSSLDSRRTASVGPGAPFASTSSETATSRSRSRGAGGRASSLMPRTSYSGAPAMPALTSTSAARSQSPIPTGPAPSYVETDPHLPNGHQQSPSRQTRALSPLSESTGLPTTSPRSAPHEHAHDRASELRAEATAARHSSSLGTSDSSAGPSRASSLYSNPYNLTNGHESSRAASLLSNEGTEGSTSHTMDASQMTVRPSRTETPDRMSDNALELVQSNVSQASISDHSDQEERGRSSRPVRGFRGQSIPEDPSVPMITGPSSEGIQAPDRQSPGSPPASVSPMSRGRSSGPPALRSSISSARSPSTSSGKATRFTLRSLMGRGQSSTRSNARGSSPDGLDKGKGVEARGTSTSRGRAPGFKAIKQALAGVTGGSSSNAENGHSSWRGGHSDSEEDSEAEEEARGRGHTGVGWQEFKAGTYSYAIYIPIPPSLPPTIHANHGSVTYMLKGFVNRAGALTTNLSSLSEVHIVASPNEDDLEAIESINVERMWETQLSYQIVIHCKSVPIGGEIPVSIRLNPLAKMKVYRLTAVLEEKFTFYARDHKVARSPLIRKHELLRIQDDGGAALLPIISDSANALEQALLKDWIPDSASTDGTGIATLDPIGPWNLEGIIKVPDCNSTLHFSTSAEQANITVLHSLKICLRVERGDDDAMDSKGVRKKFDIIIEAPMHILSCRTMQAINLPTYTTAPTRDQNVLSSAYAASTFHPHELSDAERYSSGRAAGSKAVTPVTAVRNGPSHPHPSTNLTIPNSANGVSDAQMQETLLGSAWSTGAQEAPPPTYEYARSHPEARPSTARSPSASTAA